MTPVPCIAPRQEEGDCADPPRKLTREQLRAAPSGMELAAERWRRQARERGE